MTVTQAGMVASRARVSTLGRARFAAVLDWSAEVMRRQQEAHLAGEGSVQAGANHALHDQPPQGLGKAQIQILPSERPTLHNMTACSIDTKHTTSRTTMYSAILHRLFPDLMFAHCPGCKKSPRDAC